MKWRIIEPGKRHRARTKNFIFEVFLFCGGWLVRKYMKGQQHDISVAGVANWQQGRRMAERWRASADWLR